mgnify:CR=1 FL=1
MNLPQFALKRKPVVIAIVAILVANGLKGGETRYRQCGGLLEGDGRWLGYQLILGDGDVLGADALRALREHVLEALERLLDALLPTER